MIRVQKGNKQYSIDDHMKKKYLDEGWDVVDEKGEVLEYGNPDDKEFEELEDENKKLKEEIRKLKEEIEKLKAKK